MVKTSKDTDYLFLSTYLQAKQARGLHDIDRQAAFHELEGMSPNADILRYFRLKYDYHNAKVYLKDMAAGSEHSHLYSHMGRIAPDKLVEACRSGDYRSLPKTFANGLKNASDTMERTLDPRLTDFVLDRAYLAELHETAEASGSRFLSGYATLYTDTVNLRALTRMLKSSVRPEQVKAVLFQGGSVSPAAILSRYPDTNNVFGLYRSGKLSPALKEAEQAAAGLGFAPFERAVQSCLDSYMDGAKTVCFGEEVLIRFLYRIEGKQA